MRAPASPKSTYLAQIEAFVARLPSLSTTATKILAICNNAQTSPNDLNRLIALDPVIAGQVLRLINSAYYSLAHPVSSLTRAIILLGVNTVKNLVLSLAILDRMQSSRPFRTATNASFWSHCVSVGVIAKCIAKARGVPLSEQEDFFVCGLLHDLGKIPLHHRFKDEYEKAVVLAARHSWSEARAEQAIFGVNHNTVGALIARKWQLSPVIMDVLAYHHQPGKSEGDNSGAIFIVALADLYARLLESGSNRDTLCDDDLEVVAMARDGQDGPRLDSLRDNVAAEIDKAKVFLEVSQNGAVYDR